MIRVTQVLDYLTEPELLNWFITKGKTACKKISEESLRIGTLVDGLVQQDIKEHQYLVPNGELAVSNCMKAWEEFKKDNPGFISEVQSIQMELSNGEIVGHPDILTKYKVLEIKTSRSIMPKHWTQVCQYSRMANKSIVGIIRLDKETAKPEHKEFSNNNLTQDGIPFIDYENSVFDSMFFLYKHNQTVREIVRKQLEAEVI